MTALRLLVALPLAALVGCIPPAPEPTPPPTPVAPPEPEPSAAPPQVVTPSYDNWMDAPQTPGDWFYAAIPPYTYASFGPEATRPLASIRCDRARGTVSIGRTSSATASQPMTIRTETADRTLIAEPRQGSVERLLAVDLPAHDPFLDAIVFSRGRFMIEVAGEPTLSLPAWPEIGRVVDDCR